jgi:hypothetical protein
MSTLTDIGFHAKGDDQINDMIISILPEAIKLECEGGFYLRFTDESGAELYLQGNKSQEMIGFNPHFLGTGSNQLLLTKSIAREASELDGGFLAEHRNEAGDLIRFVFDVPDFKTLKFRDVAVEAEVQLTAFATNDFTVDDGVGEERFRAVDLLPGADAPSDLSVIRPAAEISGKILSSELRKNLKTGFEFHSIQVESNGLLIDVAVDPFLVTSDLAPGKSVSGGFWLSGRVS